MGVWEQFDSLQKGIFPPVYCWGNHIASNVWNWFQQQEKQHLSPKVFSIASFCQQKKTTAGLSLRQRLWAQKFTSWTKENLKNADISTRYWRFPNLQLWASGKKPASGKRKSLSLITGRSNNSRWLGFSGKRSGEVCENSIFGTKCLFFPFVSDSVV